MYGGKFAFTINWASLFFGKKFTVFLFYLVLRDNLLLWRGLYMEGGLIFRISRYLCCLLHSRTSGVQIRIANMWYFQRNWLHLKWSYLQAHVHPSGFARLCFCFERPLLTNSVFWLGRVFPFFTLGQSKTLHTLKTPIKSFSWSRGHARAWVNMGQWRSQVVRKFINSSWNSICLE